MINVRVVECDCKLTSDRLRHDEIKMVLVVSERKKLS